MSSNRTANRRLKGERKRARIVALAERDGPVCWWCGCDLALDDPATTVDEWVPLGRDGRAEIGNQVLACRTCNNDKADMTGAEYLGRLAGSTPSSYYEWRVELKRRQRAGWPSVTRGVDPPRARRRPSALTSTLAESWPTPDA